MGSAEAQYLTVLGLSTAAAISLYFLIPLVSSIGGSRPQGPVIPGLRNWANWCFCNSVLQSLASLPTLAEYLDEQVDVTNEKLSEKEVSEESLPLSRTMRGMIRVLNMEGPSKTLSSAPLVSALEIVQKTRISRAQQDAQEFLHVLLESMAAELNGLSSDVSIQQMSTQASRGGRAYKALPFEGAIKTTNTCTTCRHELKAQTSPFLELTLLPPTSNRMTLSDCIAKTFESEMIEDYHCIHCRIAMLKQSGAETKEFEEALVKNPDYELPPGSGRSHVTLQRQAVFEKLPQILVLHINRSLFGGAYATRNSIDVTYGEILQVNQAHYVLRSFVTHRGSHDRGHYIAYRRKSGKWYAISDETVRLVDDTTALNMGGATFLMFYERVNDNMIEEKHGRKQLRHRRKKRTKQRQSIAQDALEMDAIESKI